MTDDDAPLTWIATDPGGGNEPCRIATGRGVPGIDPPVHLVELPPRSTVDEIITAYLKAKSTLHTVGFEVFDTAGMGFALWNEITRRAT